ncbi:DUF4224 domain-containing protein [Aquincola sp. J276]|uniref:DUF4224 domain-containing protein n=1 Tax=Aquincola sp. J276 TaxID=2898432 RepID=UPI002150CD3B|nr:DUF4224 domain-containing protein [Aquincola sp. J276]MCR5865215.1 DUF4224 domain-containing protein [Aquincola sp. J276]
MTDDEIAELCAPLKAPSAQARCLSGLGLLVARKPNGRPLLMRSELERVLGAERFSTDGGRQAPREGEPDRARLIELFAARGAKRRTAR